MLKRHVENRTLAQNQNNRFGKLLMLIVGLRVNIAQKVEKTFFERIIGTAKMEKLLCDMFQS